MSGNVEGEKKKPVEPKRRSEKSGEKTFQLCFDWVGRHFNNNFALLFSEVFESLSVCGVFC